jgi:hypothetical protein
MEEISRRSFVAGTGVIAGVGAAASIWNSSSIALADDQQASETASTRPERGTGAHPYQIDTIGADAQPIAPVEPPDSWDYEVDAVVVGTGMGGSTAIAYLAEQGLTVIGLEKDATTGGAGRQAAYNQINCGGSKAQNEMGFAYPSFPFDSQKAAQEVLKKFQYSIEPNLLERSLVEGGKWADWMCDQPDMNWKCAGYYFGEADFIDGKKSAPLANGHTIDTLNANATAAGATIMLNTTCDALVMDDDAVVGVVATTPDEGEIYIKAAKGVILCAGGMGNNLDMLEKYEPSAYQYAVAGGPMPSHTGECILMGVGAGADISGYNSFCCWDGGLDEYWGETGGNYCQYLFDPVSDLIANEFPRFDINGNREAIYGSQSELDKQPFTGMMEASLNQVWTTPDHRSRKILDSHFNEYAEWWADNVRGGFDRLCPSRMYTEERLFPEALALLGDDWKASWDQSVERGVVKTADTLEELAPMIGMEPQVLVDAVAKYNELVEKGVDDETLIPWPVDIMFPIQDPPFYGIVSGGHIGKTLAGLRINDQMQVLNTQGQVIPGLYAGWTTAGGLCGENLLNSYWGAPSVFAGVGMSGVGGWMCAKSVNGEFAGSFDPATERVHGESDGTEDVQETSTQATSEGM